MEARVPHLYRALLHAAKRFPSIKRDQIVRDIKIEFRENKDVTDAAIRKMLLSQAVEGLRTLEKYSVRAACIIAVTSPPGTFTKGTGTGATSGPLISSPVTCPSGCASPADPKGNFVKGL
eukprot:jgi/Mesvir1/12854/Mv05883-RA.1